MAGTDLGDRIATDIREQVARSGRVEVTLPAPVPHGLRLAGTLPSLGGLFRSGRMPTNLRAIALKAADPSWLIAARNVPEAADQAEEYLRHLIASFPREAWNVETVAWEPFTLQPDDLRPDGWMDELSIDLLEDLVLHMRTADQITAMSREMLGIRTLSEPTEEEVREKEASATIPGWEAFRGQPGGGASGVDGEPLGGPAVDDAGHPERRRRVPRGRGHGDHGADRTATVGGGGKGSKTAGRAAVRDAR